MKENEQFCPCISGLYSVIEHLKILTNGEYEDTPQNRVWAINIKNNMVARLHQLAEKVNAVDMEK